MNSRFFHLCIVLLFLFGGCNCRKVNQSPAVSNLKVGSSDKFFKTKQPITLAEARTLTKFTYPETATNIQLSMYRDFPLVAEYIRFEAPVEDCLKTATTMLENFNKSDSHTIVPLMSDELHPEWSRGAGEKPPITWFDPEKITKGQCGGMMGSHTPVIWVDMDKGIFYYQYTD